MIKTTTIIEIINGQIARVDTKTKGQLSNGHPVWFSKNDDFIEQAKTPQEKAALRKAMSEMVNAPEYRAIQKNHHLAHQRTIEAVREVFAPALLSGTCELHRP